jgi:TRAP-type transport system small permease protein
MEVQDTRHDAIARLPKALRALVTVERFASVVLLLAILGIMAAQVVARYVLDSPIPWSEELAKFALIWLAFVAAAAVMAEGRHMTVDVVPTLLGPRGALALETLVSILILGVCAAFLPAGVQFIQQLSGVRSPAMQIPMSWWYSAAVAGFALLAFHTVVNLVMAFRRKAPLWRENKQSSTEVGPGANL